MKGAKQLAAEDHLRTWSLDNPGLVTPCGIGMPPSIGETLHHGGNLSTRLMINHK